MSTTLLNRSVGIHDGAFHADEITACALLLLFDLIDRDKITRSRDLDLLETCEFVCDVGGIYDPKQKRFDHHQESYEGELSSAGMILLYLYDEAIIQEDLYHYLNRTLVYGVDLIDNGFYEPPLGLCTYSMVISSFMPPSYNAEEENVREQFERALDFTIDLIRRLIARFDYIQSCSGFVKEAMHYNKPYLLFYEAMPWLESFFELGGNHHPAQFVVMPSKDHWKLRAIPPTLENRMQVRNPLPEAWAGLLGEDLKKASGIEGAIFCHKGRFISIWETKEDALRALKIALEEES